MGKYYLFNTLIKADHKFGDNEYVRGRLTGIALYMLDGEHIFGMYDCDKGRVFTNACTARQYKKFAIFVEKHYPGLCEFDWREESK